MFSAPSIGTPMPHFIHALCQQLPRPVFFTVALLFFACRPAWTQTPTWQTQSPSALRVAEPGVALAQPPVQSEMPMAEGEGYNGPSPKTLDDFVALAERSHPRLRAARAAIEAARGKAVQARLYPNPQSWVGSPQMTPKQSWKDGNGASTQYFVGGSQDVVTAGKLRLSQQAALREVQKTEYELIRARFDVLRDVRQTYYSLLVAQRRLEIYQLLLDIAKRSYDIGRQLAEAGEGTKADVLFWSIERDRAEVRLLNASVFIETGRRQLAAAIGLPRVDIGKLEADLFQKLPNFDLKQLQEAVVRSNARPRVLESQIAGNQWALERAVVQPIPNVNVMGGYQREMNYPVANQGLFQVTMTVPLFDRNQGNIRAARAEIASSRANMRMIELDLATQTAQAVAAYRTSQRLVAWYEEYILPKARETVSLTQTLYARGEVTFLSLLQAQRILTETELAYVDSQAERWTGAVAIADLLQLEMFPPPADAPAVIGIGESSSELNRLKQDDQLKKRPEPVPPVAPAAVAPRADMEPLQMPPPVARPIDPLRPVAP